jgi:competence protein ComEA
MKLWEHVMLTVTAGLLGAGLLVLVNSQPRGEPVVLRPQPTPAPLQVHVDGAVNQPGLYNLPIQSRVQDAINAAGGVSAEADLETINLAALLEDGEKLDIPHKGKENRSLVDDEKNDQNKSLVNINTASLYELETLPGIGPTMAQSIIDYRQEHGFFTQIEQIMNVPGIGPSTFERIKEYITID